MRTATLGIAVSVVVAGPLLAGCATTSYSRTRVEALPAAVKGKAGESATLEIEGVKLRIEALDRTPKRQAVPPLALRIVFDPQRLGYAFDPTQVVLRGPDGAAFVPRASGPGRFDAATWSCSGAAPPVAAAAGRHAVVRAACFELAYDVVLHAGARFTLDFGGLTLGARRIEPVPLRLARRNGTSIDRVYWLEGLGYLLMPLGS